MSAGPNTSLKPFPYLKYALRLLVSGALLAFLSTKVDLDAFVSAFSRARLDYLTIVVAIMLAERYLAAYRWQILLRCGQTEVRFNDLLRIIFASAFFGLFLPGGSIDALRVIGQSRKSNDLAFAFSSVLLDRLLGVFALAAIALIALNLSAVELDPTVFVWAIAVLALSLGIIVAGQSDRLRLVVDPLLSPPWLAKPREKYRKLMFSLETMQRNRGVMLWAIALAFGIQVFRVATVVFAALAIGIDLPLSIHFAFVPLIFFIQLLPISVGGFGTREAAFIYLYGSVGVANELALTLSLLMYFTTLVAGIPGAWVGYSAFGKAKPASAEAPLSRPL